MPIHIVTAALAVVADSTGRRGYFYQGSALPEGIPDAELARLIELGMIAEVADLFTPPAPLEPTPEPAPAAEFTGPPAQADPKSAWVDYAVSQGTDRASAEAMTKAELIERFGTADVPAPAPA